MTSTNRFLNLRRIINPRNLFIGFVLLCACIAPAYAAEAWLNVTPTWANNLQHHHTTASPATWAHLTQTDVNYDYNNGYDCKFGISRYSATEDQWIDAWRAYLIFDTSSIPDDRYIIDVYWNNTPAGQYSNPAYDVALYRYEYSDTLTWWHALDKEVERWNHLPSTHEQLDYELVNVSKTGNTNFFIQYTMDKDNTGLTDYTGTTAYTTNFNSNVLCVKYSTDPPPEKELDLSASGTFCYGHEISFNLSETLAQTYGMYDISLYLNGDAVSKYSETIFDDGPLLWSKTLEPGNWAALGWWVGGDEELTTWVNFTINSTCDASTFSGTINESYSPGGVTVYDWEWNAYDYLNNLEPWDVPTFDNGNGTSLIDYMLSEGIINQTEYDIIYNMVLIELANQNNLTNTTISYTYGVLTPFEMINDSISTIRADVNSSYSILNDAISPISTIFTWIFQIIPIAIIDLMSVILVFDAVRVILAGRKN